MPTVPGLIGNKLPNKPGTVGNFFIVDKDVKYIKGVGPNRVQLLNKLNINTLEDLITYFPRTYEDRSIPKKNI